MLRRCWNRQKKAWVLGDELGKPKPWDKESDSQISGREPNPIPNPNSNTNDKLSTNSVKVDPKAIRRIP